MPFPVDAEVVVLALGKRGRIAEAARSGRYRVRVGGVLMLCREEELADAASEGRSRAKARNLRTDAALRGDDARPSQAERSRLASLDLHGFTVEEAVRKVEERIDLALRAGLDRVEIIHGRSSGRIKAAVHRLLAELTAVRHFEVATDNPGLTRVFF